MANIKITDLTAYTDPLNTDVLPIVDVTSDTTKKVSIADLLKNASAGTAAAPGIAFDGDNTGIYSPGADQLAISTNGTQRISIGSDGDINIDSGGVFYDASTNSLAIGTTSPGALLDCEGSSTTDGTALHINNTTGANTILVSTGSSYSFSGVGASTAWLTSAGTKVAIGPYTAGDLQFINGGEKARIDSSGRLLVGTSTAREKFFNSASFPLQVQLETATTSARGLSVVNNSGTDVSYGSFLVLGRSAGSAVNTYNAVSANYKIGAVSYQAADGTELVEAARIEAEVDGTPGANDMPGRLVFSVTADGASSPTERVRIGSTGELLVGKTVANNTSAGLAAFDPGSEFYLSLVHNSVNSAHRVLLVNRQNSDGHLIDFFQAETLEGTISVSGTTVTYGGGHLARWSQLPNNEDPSEILKGTVMSNLDEMCEWIEEDNEQLNKTKISDVEGDKNVAGVFVATSFSDDGPLDFFIGMTGDMVIRIAEGVTVERGDLLMSAGDGTAKPQDDDIIRSKTIAKVTSTNVSCTYADGSYCVPCVLMAC